MAAVNTPCTTAASLLAACSCRVLAISHHSSDTAVACACSVAPVVYRDAACLPKARFSICFRPRCPSNKTHSCTVGLHKYSEMILELSFYTGPTAAMMSDFRCGLVSLFPTEYAKLCVNGCHYVITYKCFPSCLLLFKTYFLIVFHLYHVTYYYLYLYCLLFNVVCFEIN